MTLTQFSLLAGLYWLTQQGEAVTQQRLADYAHTDKMMTSKVLQTLARKGVVERRDNPRDGRTKQLVMTTFGEAQLRQANTIVEQVDKAFFRPLAATPHFSMASCNGLPLHLRAADSSPLTKRQA